MSFLFKKPLTLCRASVLALSILAVLLAGVLPFCMFTSNLIAFDTARYIGSAMFYGGIVACLCVCLSTRFRSGWQLRKHVLSVGALFCILLAVFAVVEAPAVNALTPLPSDKGPNNSSAYKFSVPFTEYQWVVAQFRDGTYYAVNGSDWNILTIVEPWQPVAPWASLSSNKTGLVERVLSVTTSGKILLNELSFDYSLTIPTNVTVVESLNGLTRQFINSANSQGSPYTVSVDTVNTNYYLVQDGQGRFVNSFTSTNQTLVESNVLTATTSGSIMLSELRHNYSLAVPSNVFVTENYKGNSRTFINPLNNTGCPFSINLDTAQTGYYLGSDSKGNIFSVSNNATTIYTALISNSPSSGIYLNWGVGRFTVDSLSLPAKPWRFVGQGMDTTEIYLRDNTNADLFYYTTATNVTFSLMQALTLNGNRAHQTTGMCVNINPTGAHLWDCRWQDIFVLNGYTKGFYTNDGHHNVFDHCVIEYNGQTNTPWVGAFDIGGGDAAYISNCLIKLNYQRGALISSYETSITGTKFIQNNGVGLVSNNELISVTACTFESNGLGASNMLANLFVGGDRGTYVGNTYQGTSAKYCIEVTSGSDYNSFTGEIFKNFGTANMTNAGTGNIFTGCIG